VPGKALAFPGTGAGDEMGHLPCYAASCTANAYIGMSPCSGATTREDIGAAGRYPTQVGSNPGYPATETNAGEEPLGG
jgi:hypothetical protein